MKKDEPLSEPILEDQLGLSAEPAFAEEPAPSTSNVPVVDDLSGGSEKQVEKSTELRRWYRRPKLWGVIAAACLGLIILILGFVSWRNRSADRDFISSQWRGIIQATDRASSEAAKGDYGNFDGAYQALADLGNRLDDATSDAAKQPTFLGDKASLDAFGHALSSLKDYTAKAKAEANDLANTKSQDLDSLKSSATATKLSVENDLGKFSFVEGRIGDDFYKLSERFNDVISAHQQSEDAKRAADQALVSKEAQAKQDQADAEEAAARWTQAYIAGSVDDMKKYMTAAFAKEYDFGQVTASYRSTNYPTSYRRVSTEKKDPQYEIVETITYVTKSDFTPDTTYTTTFTFLVAQDVTSKKWLVNSQRYQ